MTWVQRLERVFAIDIETCQRCGARLRVIARIENPALIERILAHRQRVAEGDEDSTPFVARAPPQPSLL